MKNAQLELADVVRQFRDAHAAQFGHVMLPSQKKALTGVEFLRRLLMHVLPKGFHKARYYGLWHSSKRPLQQRARLLLALETPAQTAVPMTVADLGTEAQRAADDRSIGPESSEGGFRPRCPHCGSDRVIHLAESPRGRSP